MTVSQGGHTCVCPLSCQAIWHEFGQVIISLSLSFLLYKMELVTPTSQGYSEVFKRGCIHLRSSGLVSIMCIKNQFRQGK